MKVTSTDVFSCEGGWCTLNFIQIETDEGITGYSECNCVRSQAILRVPITALGDLVIGRDPFQTERIQFDLYRATQRQLGGVAHQAISGMDAVLLDIKGKALGVLRPFRQHRQRLFSSLHEHLGLLQILAIGFFPVFVAFRPLFLVW